MPLVHKNILISGKVQGVFFRASAKRTADELALKGFVANKPDGKVYAEAEGDAGQVDRFITWCRQGPVAAIVEGLEVTDGPLKNFTDFRISR